MLKTKGQKILKSAPSEYICQYCKIEKSLNKDNFQVVSKFKHGFSTVCNECNINTNKMKNKTD